VPNPGITLVADATGNVYVGIVIVKRVRMEARKPADDGKNVLILYMYVE
jgi:hypothetical protein